MSQLEARLREASRLGVGHAVVPHFSGPMPKLGGMAIHGVRRIQQALADLMIERKRRSESRADTRADSRQDSHTEAAAEM